MARFNLTVDPSDVRLLVNPGPSTPLNPGQMPPPWIPPGPGDPGRPEDDPDDPSEPDTGPTGPRAPYPGTDPTRNDPPGPGSGPDYLPGTPTDPGVRR